MKIVIDKAIPFLCGLFEPFGEVVYLDGKNIGREEVKDADALVIRTRTKCNESLLDGSKVRIIATATIGFDHIDTDYCRRHNIAVATAAGCNARGVLQWVAAVLAHIVGDTTPQSLTLGIVGVGAVGSLVKEYAEQWGFRTICCDPPREEAEHLGFVALEEVLRQADIVTLHTPLDYTTYHLINRENISLLKSGATLINASRGEVVDTQATLRNDIRYAIDVWEGEPNIDRILLEKATIATPHIAGYSLQGKANASSQAVAAVAHHLNIPVGGWYPKGVERTTPQQIGWEELRNTITDHYDILGESQHFKRNAEAFEQLRNEYRYRNEYF
ncbi:MAG: 4-phosphoerythronate dehydrogenase [Alistipes sp.]|nr:4-phosphoerythronate dehydrogenase [Alistipes sp.]